MTPINPADQARHDQVTASELGEGGVSVLGFRPVTPEDAARGAPRRQVTPDDRHRSRPPRPGGLALCEKTG